MRWTNMSEKEMIKAWAVEEFSERLQEEYLPQPNLGKKSYWTSFHNSGNLTEYDFGTIPELKAMLEQELGDEIYKDLVLPLAIAAMKEKKIIQIEDEDKEEKLVIQKEGDELLIPDFVYNF